MFLSMLGLWDVIAAIVALTSINFGIFPNLSYILLMGVLVKGIWSIMASLK